MERMVVQAVRVMVLLVLATPAPAQNLNLELRRPTFENLFSRYVYVCEACSLAQWAQLIPPPGFEKVPPRIRFFESGSVVLPSPPPGVPASLDLVPDIPGDDHFYVAKLLDAQFVGFHVQVGPMVVAQVQRDTRLLLEPGTVVHQLTDPQGGIFTLFTFDLAATTVWDVGAVGGLAGLPIPPGWSYSSRVLGTDLLIVSNGLATVFAQGPLASWQRQEVVQVAVNVVPGAVNPRARGVVPVAILGEEDLDVTTLDPTTLALGPGGAAPAHKSGGHLADTNGDGIPDLLSHYRIAETGLQAGDATLCVSGETLEGVLVEGCGALATVP